MDGYNTKQPPKLWIQNIVPAKLKPTNQPTNPPPSRCCRQKTRQEKKNASSLQVFFQRTATKIQKKLPRTTLTTRIRTTLPKKGLQLLLKRRKKPKVDIKFPKVPTLLCIGDLIILEFFFACCLFLWKVVLRKSNHDGGGDFWIFFETQKCYQKCCHRVALELAFPGSFGLWQPLTLPLRKAISSGGDKARKASGNARRSSTCLALLK